MKPVNSFDKKIRQCLIEETKQIETSKNLFQTIKIELKQKGDDNMKFHFTPKKLVAVCILCLTTVVCIAAPKISSWQSSTANTGIATFPSKNEVKKLVNYTPKYVESLSKDFKFKEANVTNTQGTDEAGNIVVELKEFSISYERSEKNDEKEFLNVISSNKSEDLFNQEHASNPSKSENQSSFNDITLYYNEMPYKFVPVDYELTQEDKKAQENGEIEISYGSSKIENTLMQYVSWYENGVEYLILGSNVNLTKDQLFEMAQTVISESK